MKKIRNTTEESKNDVNTKKIIFVMGITAGLILIFVLLFVYPNYISMLSNDADNIPSSSDPSYTSGADTYTTKSFSVSSDFDSYNYSMSIDDVLKKCGEPNIRLSQSLTYNYVYLYTYLSDMTFLFENNILYGCLYDIIKDANKTIISLDDYYSLKNMFIEKYGEPVKSDDGRIYLNNGEKCYSRWDHNDSYIKIEISHSDGLYKIVIGYIEKSKADN